MSAVWAWVRISDPVLDYRRVWVDLCRVRYSMEKDRHARRSINVNARLHSGCLSLGVQCQTANVFPSLPSRVLLKRARTQ
jgi:hypothetical protein